MSNPTSCAGVSQATLATCASLENRVQAAVWGPTHGAASTAPFFVKTSMRSPKDAVKVQHEPSAAPHERLRAEVAACWVVPHRTSNSY